MGARFVRPTQHDGRPAGSAGRRPAATRRRACSPRPLPSRSAASTSRARSLAAREVRAVRRLQALRAQHDRARRQGRGRRDRVRAGRRPARAHGRRDAAVLRPEGARRARCTRERHLHDRSRRRASRTRSSRRAGPISRSSARDGSVWTTTAGLGWVNPYDRRVWDYCVSVAEAAAKRRLRPDHVRLRPLPLRRRRWRAPSTRARRASRGAASSPTSSSYAKKRLEPRGVARLDRALRALRDAGSRHRPGAAVDLEARRQRLPDVLPGPLRRR